MRKITFHAKVDLDKRIAVLSKGDWRKILIFSEDDEWMGFEFKNKVFDFHWCFEDKFEPAIYKVNNNQTDTSEGGQQILIWK